MNTLMFPSFSKQDRPELAPLNLIVERERAALGKVHGLSNREAQILHCIVDGIPGKGMAHRLGISHRTVEIHRARLLRKLGTSNSYAAAVIGALAGFGSCVYLDERELVEPA